ncbi:Hypothetical protein SLIV_36482 [Streptomyces lividans TK24]|uniref:Uncharacterized protein n=1 Tax=Streptomyces lividans TK24 TaxID=457428 RepID=A0ABX6TQ71_STRLI|nr:Hypothetical protein SLIV_36482 [Streptomyces lividans TK24]QSJ13791.1 Hypothetical protein SLIVDG2_36482 [Streptomyces lividans]QTD74701.1 Hypothetical protein SLIVYQS_36482 [Streptomyces lividans TK24] [Streptomyces lividans]
MKERAESRSGRLYERRGRRSGS